MSDLAVLLSHSDVKNGISMLHFEPDQCDCQNEKSDSLNTVEAVATTAVVCGVVCFTAGLLLASFVFFLYLTRCRQQRKISQDKNNDTEDQPAPSDGENNKSEKYLSNTDVSSMTNASVSNKDLSSTNKDLSNNDE